MTANTVHKCTIDKIASIYFPIIICPSKFNFIKKKLILIVFLFDHLS